MFDAIFCVATVWGLFVFDDRCAERLSPLHILGRDDLGAFCFLLPLRGTIITIALRVASQNFATPKDKRSAKR